MITLDVSTDFVSVFDDFVALTLAQPTDLQGSFLATGITTPPGAGLFTRSGTYNSVALYQCPETGLVLFFDSTYGWAIGQIPPQPLPVGGNYSYWLSTGGIQLSVYTPGNHVTGNLTVTSRAPTETITHGAEQSVTSREVEESFGRYQQSDKHFTWPISEGTPALGGTVIDSFGQNWIILDMNRETLMALWRVTARNLEITGGLNELVTIQQRTVAKGINGAAEFTWPTYQANVRARLQEESSDRSTQHGRQSGTVQAKCFLAQQLLLDNTYRIISAAGRTYEVTGYEKPDSIGSLTTINCMRRI